MKHLVTIGLCVMLMAATADCTSRGGTASGVASGIVVCSLPKDETPEQVNYKISRGPDLTGRSRLGKASFYAASFYHRQMADGNRMDPRGYNAASRTLPLGTTAKVTNLTTGQSAIVQIEDRGPYAKGRILDLSPATARQIGITRRIGVAPVKVAPIMIPLPDGTTKFGAGLVRPVCRAT